MAFTVESFRLMNALNKILTNATNIIELDDSMYMYMFMNIAGFEVPKYAYDKEIKDIFV